MNDIVQSCIVYDWDNACSGGVRKKTFVDNGIVHFELSKDFLASNENFSIDKVLTSKLKPNRFSERKAFLLQPTNSKIFNLTIL